MSRDPTLAELIDTAITNRLEDVHTALPGQVVLYDPITRRASVRPLVQNPYLDEEGVRNTEPLPIVTDVPVVVVGSRSHRISFPIAEGDIVLLVTTTLSIDEWAVNGGLVSPIDDRRHAISDSVAIAGLSDFSTAQGVPNDRISIGPYDDSSEIAMVTADASVYVSASEVRLGDPGATEFIGLLSDDEALKDELSTWANTPPTTPAADIAALKTLIKDLVLTGWPFGSTKVKAV